MMDRRSLLKRLGIAGLAVPAAAMVERALVLPADARAAATGATMDPRRFAIDGALYVRELKIEQDYVRVDSFMSPATRILRNSIRRVSVILEGHGDGAGLALREDGIGEFTPVRIVRMDRPDDRRITIEDTVTVTRDEAGRITAVHDVDGSTWVRGEGWG